MTATLEMEAYTIKPGMLSPMCKVKSKKRVREWDRLVAAVKRSPLGLRGWRVRVPYHDSHLPASNMGDILHLVEGGEQSY